jgi:hypothetical protein
VPQKDPFDGNDKTCGSSATPGESAGTAEVVYLSGSETSSYLAMPLITIDRWARAGRIPYVVGEQGDLRFSAADLENISVGHPRRTPLTAGDPEG